jgi:uncharacterized protein (TIGR02996 family)
MESAFREAISESPNDDLPKLVFADWLDENARTTEAMFVRYRVLFGEIGYGYGASSGVVGAGGAGGSYASGGGGDGGGSFGSGGSGGIIGGDGAGGSCGSSGSGGGTCGDRHDGASAGSNGCGRDDELFDS